MTSRFTTGLFRMLRTRLAYLHKFPKKHPKFSQMDQIPQAKPEVQSNGRAERVARVPTLARTTQAWVCTATAGGLGGHRRVVEGVGDQQWLAHRRAYLSVVSVSSKLMSAGDTQATMMVRELPPRESCSMRVSLESR